MFAVEKGYQYIPFSNEKVFKKGFEVPRGLIPIGSPRFCEEARGKVIRPAYFPEFLSFFHPEFEVIYNKYDLDYFSVEKGSVFVRPSDKSGRFFGFIHPKEYTQQSAPFIAAPYIKTQKEWREYVGDGEVMKKIWLVGRGDFPETCIVWPEKFCGAVDFALDERGECVLLGNHAPYYPSQWYGDGKEDDIFVEWLKRGWSYLNDSL